MPHQLIQTEDGSITLYVPELNEHYHSVHGAIQESIHIFIWVAALEKKRDSICAEQNKLIGQRAKNRMRR